jgi:hypothetical protein
VSELPNTPEVANLLPEHQARRGVDYSPEVMDHYAQKFGLTGVDLDARRIHFLVKSKIDSDVFIAQQNKRLATLEAKVGGLLKFVERFAKLRTKVSAKAVVDAKTDARGI